MRSIYFILFLYFSVLTTAEAQLTKITAFSGSQLKANSIIQAGDRIFFEADDGISGNELWVYDATTDNHEMVTDLNPNGDLNMGGNIIAFGNGVLFRGTDGVSGQELFFSDGTSAGTRLVKDISPSGSSFPEDFIEFNGEVYFAANDGTSGKELWKTDGTTAGTVLVKDINPGNGTGMQANTEKMFGQNGTWLFFRADDGTNGIELWITNGTTTDTRMVGDLFPGAGSGLGETVPEHAAIFLNTLFFRGNDGGTAVGKELHYFDTNDETVKVWKEINIGPTAQADVKNLFVSGDKLFFRAKFGSSGIEPWVSDGTVAGTQLIRQLRTGSGSSNPIYQIADPLTGQTYFEANGGNGNEPWVTDGTADGTHQITDLFPGSGGSGPDFFAFTGGFAYFVAQTTDGSPFGETGRELFATDGDNVFLAADINEGAGGSNPGSPKPVVLSNGRIYFATENTSFGSNLYAYNPQQFLSVPALDPFGSINIGQSSISQSFNVTYSGLSGPITVFADDGFEISLANAGAFQSDPIQVNPDQSGTINTTIHVRFRPAIPGVFEKSIRIEGHEVATVRVPVSGMGITAEPVDFLVFDDFFGENLPDGWSEPNTTGRVFIQEGRLSLFYNPGQPVVTARRTFGAASGTTFIGFIFNTERNTINVPIAIKNSTGETIAQLRFNNGIELVTSVNGSGDPTATVNLISETSVPKNVDHQVVLKIDMVADLISMEVNGQSTLTAEDIPLLIATDDITDLEISVPYMFDVGNVFMDDLLIGSVNKSYLRQKIVAASSLLTTSSIGNAVGEFPASAKLPLQNAITDAVDIFINSNDQTIIDQNEALLQVAIDIFLNSRINAQATVDINIESGHDMEEGVFGYNNRSVDLAWSYRNPEFVEALEAGKTGWMRYLSGTISDPFNMNTGTYELEWIDQFRKVPNQITAYGRVEAKGPQLVYDLYQALGEVGGKLIVTWPGFMGDPEEAGLFARFCKDNHIEVEYWQLNNEPFFFTPSLNHYFYNGGTDYAAKMRPISDAIKLNYPEALTAPSASWGVDIETGFSKQVRDFTPRFWDIYSMHSYAAFNNSNPSDALAIRNGNAGLQIGGTDAPLKVRNGFGTDMPYIITEYNVFNNTLGGTFYSGLYNAEYLMRNTAFPNARYLGLHVFNTNVIRPEFNHNSLLEAAFNGDIELNADTIQYGFDIVPAGSAILTAVEALNRSNYSWDTQVTGGETVLAEHSNSQVDNIPAIYANSYRGAYDKDYILLTNKSDIPHDITIRGLSLPANVTRVIVSSSSPLANQGFGTVSDIVDMIDGVVTIPGYSVCRLEWDSGMKVPPAPRIFKAEVSTSGAELKWWKRDNAEGYTLYYGTSPSQLNQSVTIEGADNNSHILDLPKNAVNYVAVAAFNSSGESPLSKAIDVKMAKPEAPALVKTHERNSRVTLLWKSVPYASGYRVLYGTNESSPDKEVDARNASGFTIKDLTNDTKYYFRVVAYNGEGDSPWSNVLAATPKAEVPFAPHDLRGSETSNGDVSLQWTESDSSYNATYQIFRSRTPWTNYQQVADEINGTSFVDTTNSRPGSHYYVVKAKNTSSESFYPSNILTINKNKGSFTDEIWVESRNEGSPEDDQLTLFFRIVNDREVDVPYEDIKLRYWFTNEGPSPLEVFIQEAGPGIEHIQAAFVALDPAREGADTYLELTFDAGAGVLVTGAVSGTIQVRVTKSNSTAFNETDDHSFLPTDVWIKNDQVTLYQNDMLVWGAEPIEVSITSSEPNENRANQTMTVFPNPFNDILTVYIPNHIESGRVELRDINGQLFYRKPIPMGQRELNISANLRAGIYMLQVIPDNDTPVNFKVVKNE
ncbi:T9SS type A sorting domain-containing protein [Fulvivirga sp. M361]|uniref:ELWxxDGT repeat protein n=1 Tax=Fulvivirga sp. M361 TaxID=2594266 RepID=UPI00117B1318|nr:ELWxxDGT repeat protein [Fulvivirga sp. M361]TRX59166.1 T9SS type A sorting domain-containing protein [Fulvivirga sp. M361]